MNRVWRTFHLCLYSFTILASAICLSTQTAAAERIFFAGYKDGFYIKTEQVGGMEVHLGGVLDIDYRHYFENERSDNRFDIRRARLLFNGQLTRWFRFYSQFEFQNNETDNLLDAYIEALMKPHALRLGQFKTPFSLQWQTRDKAILFGERSMGQSLSPGRSIGLMVHGSLWQDTLRYSTGLFNADGDDGSGRGTQSDSPEVACRLVVAPFKATDISWLKHLQLGASYTYAEIELANLDFRVKSAGMHGTNYNIYVLSHDTKFGVLQDIKDRQRMGVELGWSWGPLSIQSEYITFRYRDLEPSGAPREDATFSSWYAGIACALTGETLVFTDGVKKPVRPLRDFNPENGAWGAFVVGGRFDHFSGDPDWITPEAYVSVREADAYTIAVNWILFPMVRVIGDITRTEFSDPIRTRTNPDGSVDYINAENVLTLRFSIDF